jgi:hypothetical protein
VLHIRAQFGVDTPANDWFPLCATLIEQHRSEMPAAAPTRDLALHEFLEIYKRTEPLARLVYATEITKRRQPLEIDQHVRYPDSLAMPQQAMPIDDVHDKVAEYIRALVEALGAECGQDAEIVGCATSMYRLYAVHNRLPHYYAAVHVAIAAVLVAMKWYCDHDTRPATNAELAANVCGAMSCSLTEVNRIERDILKLVNYVPCGGLRTRERS